MTQRSAAAAAPGATVVAVSRSSSHDFSKQPDDVVTFVAGLGLVGDAHAGARVQHRSRVRADPTLPNLRQVHLLHAELLDELVAAGHDVGPGSLGENVTTRGLDLLGLPTGALLRLGGEVSWSAGRVSWPSSCRAATSVGGTPSALRSRRTRRCRCSRSDVCPATVPTPAQPLPAGTAAA